MATRRTHTFIVEHLDPELEEWQALEYNCISSECSAVGSSFLLSGLTSDFDAAKQLRVPTSSKTKSTVESLYPTPEQRQKVCLLDPKASKDLEPEDGEQYDAFLFGGILGRCNLPPSLDTTKLFADTAKGDDPPRDRTGDLRKLGFPGRRLGPEQMTTDTAVRVTRIVAQEGLKLDEIKYVDRPDIIIPASSNNSSSNESVSMPFKYVQGKDGLPVMPDGMLHLLANDADKDILDLL